MEAFTSGEDYGFETFPWAWGLGKGLPKILWYINRPIISPAEGPGELCHRDVGCTHPVHSSKFFSRTDRTLAKRSFCKPSLQPEH